MAEDTPRDLEGGEVRMDLEKPAPAELVVPIRPAYPRSLQQADAYGYGGGYPPSDDGFNVRQLLRIVRKRKALIAVVVAIVTTVVIIESFRTKSIYQAAATIEIEKENRTLVRTGGDVVIQTDEADDAYLISMNMKTKIRVLQSRPLLEDVVVALDLDKNPKFMDVTAKKSIPEALLTIGSKLHLGQAPQPTPHAVDTPQLRLEGQPERSAEETARLAPYVAVLAANLTAEPLEDTRMLVVSYSHTDPDLAASVANTIARVFIEKTFNNSTEKFTKTSDWLKTTTNELKSKVEIAEEKLANYTREHNLLSPDGKMTLTAGKLTHLHDQLTRVEGERMLKESLYEEVKAGRVAQLPEAFSDPKIQELQKKLNELEVSRAQLDVKYGPDNPRVVEVKQQMAVLQGQLDASRGQLEGRLKADYERAVRDEALLNGAMEHTKSEAVQENQDSIQYGMLKSEVETAKQLYVDFLQKTSQANVQVAEQHNNMRVIEPAQVPSSPVGPQRLRSIMIGLFLSLLGGLGVAFVLERFDNTIKTVEDVNRYAQLPALGVIPAIDSRSPRKFNPYRKAKAIGSGPAAARVQDPQRQSVQLTALNNRSSAAEAYRGLRTSVLLSAAGGPPKVVMVTSGQPGEGKTTTVVNTAISLAQLGSSVLIIDADLRRPTTHKVFGVEGLSGLSSYLSRDITIDSVIQKLSIPNLSLIPCGPIPPNPAELVSSEKMKEMLRILCQRYDHILIDSPPLMHVTDPVIISTLVDGVILVVHGGKSTREVVKRARQELASVGAKVFGVVLNNLDLKREGYDEYYYYYQYYASDGPEA